MTEVRPVGQVSATGAAGDPGDPPGAPSIVATPSSTPSPAPPPPIPSHPRPEGAAAPEKTAVLSETDEPPPHPDLEDTIRDIVGVLEGTDPSEDATPSSSSPDVSPSPPPIRPTEHEDPSGQRQSLVDHEEMSTIVERHRLRLHDQR